MTLVQRGYPSAEMRVASITEVDGSCPEYAAAAPRYLHSEAATEYLAQLDRPVTRMARIAVRPAWVGLVDFATRLPSALSGIARGTEGS